jgi:hypothetical protein
LFVKEEKRSTFFSIFVLRHFLVDLCGQSSVATVLQVLQRELAVRKEIILSVKALKMHVECDQGVTVKRTEFVLRLKVDEEV